MMFINLYIQFMTGPQAGEEMTIMCLGVNNFLFRMDEISRIENVHVIGFEVVGLFPSFMIEF
jgi:hypothetical protein